MTSKRKVKKFFKDFYLKVDAAESAHMIEYQLPPNTSFNNPFYEGMFTIRNDADDRATNYSFKNPDKYVPGWLESTKTKAIDLTSKEKKIYRRISASVFHFFADDVAEILYTLELHPDAILILDISTISGAMDTKGWEFFQLFLDALTRQGITYKLVDIDKFDIIYINNFCVSDTTYRVSLSGEKIYKLFLPFVKNKKVKPFRNVYVSRRAMNGYVEERMEKAKDLSVSHDNRIDSHDDLENYFRELGYEIIVPEEDFATFADQINYFYSVKTLASLTSSGISNALFMQPGGTVIEITTPLVVESPLMPTDMAEKVILESGASPRHVQEIHNFYKVLSYLKGHSYISINNPLRSVSNIRKIINADPKLKNFIDRND